MIGAGIAIGMGVMIKQAAAFDALALGLFLLWTIRQENKRHLQRLVRLATMTLVVVLPLAVVAW